MKHILGRSLNFMAGPRQGAVNTVILINLVLAAVALCKDIFLASYLGTSSQADAFWLAFFIPDTVGQNFIGVALSAACIPVLSRLYVAKDFPRLRNTISSVTLYFSVGALILAAAFFLARGVVIQSLGPTLEPGITALCTRLFTIMLPAIILFPYVYIGMAVMQVHNRFNVPALVPVLYNVVLLGGVLFSFFGNIPLDKGVNILAGTVLAGAFFMLALTWMGMHQNPMPVSKIPVFRQLSRSAAEVRETFKAFIPYMLIIGSTQGMYFFERYLASGLEPGSVAGLTYAFRITQFPIWVFVAAISTVSFPAMSKSFGLGRTDVTRKTFMKALRLVVIIILPLAGYLYLLREPVVSILFQRGSFDAGSVHITTGVMAGYAVSVVFQGLAALSLRTLMALNRSMTALVSFLLSSGVTVLADFQMVPRFGLAGLGYGMVLGSMINAGILLLLLNQILQLRLGQRLQGFMKIVAANVVLLPLAGLFQRIWVSLGIDAGFAAKAAFAALIIAVSGPAYWFSLRLFRVGFEKMGDFIGG